MLVLNATYEPINVCTVRRATVLLLKARAELLERGMEIGEVQEFAWGKFIFFQDPDGNGWAVQELPPRD